MNRGNLIPLLALLFFVVIYGIIYYDRDRYNWNEWDDTEAYKEHSEEPWGYAAFSRLLSASFGNKLEEINSDGLDELVTCDATKTVYVFAGVRPYYDSIEIKRMLSFLDRGGKIWMSSKFWDQALVDSMAATCPPLKNDNDEADDDAGHNYIKETFHSVGESDSITSLTVAGDSKYFSYSVFYKDKKGFYNLNVLNSESFCFTHLLQVKGYALGANAYSGTPNSKPIHLEFGYRKGAVELHSVPLVFTNYHLLRKETRPYTNSVLKGIDREYVLIDLYSKTEAAKMRGLGQEKASTSVRNNHFLRTMLREPSLGFAWFIFLGMVGLLIVFGSKREQRLIPVIPALKNQSVQFVESLSRLQFKQQDFRSVCKQDMRYFLNILRDKTGTNLPMLPTGSVPYTNTNIEQIALLSGFPEPRIRDIFTRYEACVNYEPNGEMMVDLHTSIEQFVHFKKKIGNKNGRSNT
jgi:hypothetical protein